MVKLALIQWVVMDIIGIILYVFWGARYTASFMLGAMAYAIPTLVSILFLNILKPYPVLAGVAFWGSESLKILLSLILLIGCFFVYPNLHFISFLLGLVLVSHLVFLLFLKVYRYGSK